MPTGPTPRAMPADFRTYAPGKPLLQIMNRYRAGAKAVYRWLEEAGIQARPKPGTSVREVPENFSKLAPTMTAREAAAFWEAGEHQLRRWRKDAGVEFRRSQNPWRTNRRATGSEAQRDVTLAGQAADFLRKLAPLWRCDADGSPNPKGTHWRRNMRVLSDEELIERAAGLGFDPGVWERLPSAIERHAA